MHQRESQVQKHGADKAAWLVDWIDPKGRRRRQSCGPGARGKRDAEKLADKIHSQLVTGTYESRERMEWPEFIALYEDRVLKGDNPTSAQTARTSLATFAAVGKPGRMRQIDAGTIEAFVSRRLSPLDKDQLAAGPATVNRELRYVRHAPVQGQEVGNHRDGSGNRI